MAIRNCAYKFLSYHCAFIQKCAHGSTVSQSHGRVSTRGHQIYKSTSTPLLGEVLECKIEVVTSRIASSGSSAQENVCWAWQNIGSLIIVSPKSRKYSLYGYWRVRCFPIHVCPLLRCVVIVFASQTSFLQLCGLTFDATLGFSICFLKILLG